MQEKDQIAELFKDTFNNYEAPVRPELWQQVASKIQAPATPSVPDGSSVAQITATTSKISGGIIGWVAATIVVVSTVTGYYLYNREQVAPSDRTVQQQLPSAISDDATESLKSIDESRVSIQQPNSSSNLNSNGSGLKATEAQETSNQQHSDISTDLTSEGSSSGETGSGQALKSTEIMTSTSSKEAVSGNSGTLKNKDLNTSENQATRNKVKANPSSGYAPLEVEFTASHYDDGNEWLFGDGTDPLIGFQVKHTFNQPGTYLVTLKNTDANGKIFTELVKIEVLSDLTITNVPNIFTPNGDGTNDVFQIMSDKDLDIEVSIFDNTGKFVYKFNGIENSWNGKINNLQDAGEGTYFYVIFASGKNGEKNTQKGTITLKR